MNMKFYKVHDILNSEGALLSILRSESNSIYIMGQTLEGIKVISMTNEFLINLYLNSRITLFELMSLNQSQHYYIMTGNRSEAVFFEWDSTTAPGVFKKMVYGNQLYHLLPDSIRTSIDACEIIESLNHEPVEENSVNIDSLPIIESEVNFFNNTKSPIRFISIDSDIHNPDDI
jgi:hypothetical protein